MGELQYAQTSGPTSKLEHLIYKTLQVQPYLTNEGFTYKEMYLLYALRCRSHPAKSNYRTLYNGQVQCSLGCLSDETQQHIFEECKILRAHLQLKEGVKISDIFGNFDAQKSAMYNFIQIEEKRVKKKCKKQSVYMYKISFLC